MRYNRGDLNATLRAALAATGRPGALVPQYVYATGNGYIVSLCPPPAQQAYYRVLPTRIVLCEPGRAGGQP